MLAGLLTTGCVRPTLEGRRCADADDCLDGYRCVAAVCLAPDRNPAADALLNDDCPALIGADALGPIHPSLVADASRVAVVGSLLPLTKDGTAFSTGAARQEAVALGLTEINRNGGVFGRSVVGLACNSDGDVDTAIRAAAHLADVGVPVVIGEQSSTTTLAVFSEVLRPAGILMIAPSATSVDLSTVPDDDLLIRTTVSDARQAAVLGSVLVDGRQRVAVVAAKDSYGDTLLDGARRVVCETIDCGDPQAYVVSRFDAVPDAAVVDVVASAVGAVTPEAVAIIGQAAQVRPMLERLGVDHPTAVFVLSDAARSEVVFSTPTPLAPAIAARVLGTAPSQRPEGAAFTELQGNLSDEAADKSFVAHAYDAAVVAGLLHAAVGDALHPTGAALVARLSMLVGDDGASPLFTIGASAGPRDVAVALRTLEGGEPVDLQGTSGPLDFDGVGDVSGDIELWRRCPTPPGDAITVSLGVALAADGTVNSVDTACRCDLPGIGCPAGQICADDGVCLATCAFANELCATASGDMGVCSGQRGGALGCR